MKIFLIIFAVAMFAGGLNSFGAPTTLKTEKDSLSYCIGLDLGKSIMELDYPINLNVLSAAVGDILNNKQVMKHEDAVKFLREYFTARSSKDSSEVIDKAAPKRGLPTTLKTEKDSVSYCIGLDVGNYIREHINDPINLNVLLAAFGDILNDKPAMKHEDVHELLHDYFTVRKPARALKASREFLDMVAKEKDVQTTGSGLLYKIIKQGDDVRAVNDYDRVKALYHGTFKDGKVFDSTRERGDTATFILNSVIEGWREGVKLIGRGGSIKIWIPAELAYGETGSYMSIGPNEALIFEIDLIDVIEGVEEEEYDGSEDEEEYSEEEYDESEDEEEYEEGEVVEEAVGQAPDTEEAAEGQAPEAEEAV
ncbi:MAG: FKBP-type peptidyl-prolyl cis-trans isomerase [Rikenellaceae bacterium]|jgi:FKBP-type peptidyl-prolyl cis-trans isomerase|nr:FKBP-type peptidyl-prolyl cis-trans isomerase [Rikenellaceae bacterium]